MIFLGIFLTRGGWPEGEVMNDFWDGFFTGASVVMMVMWIPLWLGDRALKKVKNELQQHNLDRLFPSHSDASADEARG